LAEVLQLSFFQRNKIAPYGVPAAVAAAGELRTQGGGGKWEKGGFMVD
jgi:hypothetical protein